MKYLALTFSLITALLFSSCETEGPQGPQGPPGFDGLNEEQVFTQVFDETNVNFTSTDNNIAIHSVSIPNNVAVEPADVIAIYILNQELTDAADANVWEPLPRIFSDGNNGIIQYHFNFIIDLDAGIKDIEIVLEANNFNSLTPGFKEDVIFRIAVIPSAFANELNTNAKNLNGTSVIYDYEDIIKDAIFVD